MLLFIINILYFITCTGGIITNPVCPPGNVIISSDEERESFLSQYPDCTCIQGDLIIGAKDRRSSTQIRILKGLEGIRHVDGDLIIMNNVWLKSIRPLSHIESIGGSFVVRSNPELSEAFPQCEMTRIEGDLTIAGLKSGKTFTFNNLRTVGGHVTLSAFSGSMSMFPQLEEIGGDLRLTGNYLLEEIEDFNRVRTIGGTICISDNASLRRLTAFDNLEQVKAVNLENLDLDTLSIGKGINSIEDISLKHVHYAGTLAAFSEIVSLRHLFLQHVPNDIILSFQRLAEAEYLSIFLENPDIAPFPALAIVHRDVNVHPDFLEALTDVHIGNDLNIRYVQDVTQLKYLSLVQAGHMINIEDGSFYDFNGLPEIQANTLRIRNNQKIRDLEGLDLARLRVNALYIEGNSITSLNGLHNIPEKALSIVIQDNKNLVTCAAGQVCELLNCPKISWSIRDNGEQCDMAAVKKQCETRG